MDELPFAPGAIFPYNLARKLRFAIIVFVLIALVMTLFAGYILFLKESNFFLFEMMRSLVMHIKGNIAQNTLLGSFYVALFGGLFFVTLPLEAIFVNFLREGSSPYLLIVIYLFGFIVSYTINYLIGQKLDTFSKKIISPKKFYKIKGIINKHGALAVFGFNLIPFFPSQPLATILGVFRYNKTKFYLFFVLGQLVKYAAIAAGYTYLFA